MKTRLILLSIMAVVLGLAGFVAWSEFAAPPQREQDTAPSSVYDPRGGIWALSHGFVATETRTENDFQALLQWERDGIFPRLGYDRYPPDWYMAEKKRRGIVITPERIVTLAEQVQPSRSAPPVLNAPISSDLATMLETVDFKRRSVSEIVLTKPSVYGDRLVREWEWFMKLPWERQPSAMQQWMAQQVHQAVNDALRKVGYQASERNLADGQFYVIEKKK